MKNFYSQAKESFLGKDMMPEVIILFFLILTDTSRDESLVCFMILMMFLKKATKTMIMEDFVDFDSFMN